MDTINFYNNNAKNFIENTKNIDMSNLYNEFLYFLNKGDTILDFGCGSGRDSLYFKNNGYNVTAMDGSIEICKEASILTGLNVEQKTFMELNDVEKYDGIWACASLLHSEFKELPCIFSKMYKALNKDGVCYISFKYGNDELVTNNKHYTNMDEQRFNKLISTTKFKIIKIWYTEDKLKRNEKWMNIIISK